MQVSFAVTVKDLISNDLNIVGNTGIDLDTSTYSLPTPPHSDPDSPASGVLGELENSQTIDEFITANEVQVCFCEQVKTLWSW